MSRAVLDRRYSDEELRAILAQLAESQLERSLAPQATDARLDYTIEEVIAAGAEIGAAREEVEQAILTADLAQSIEADGAAGEPRATPSQAPLSFWRRLLGLAFLGVACATATALIASALSGTGSVGDNAPVSDETARQVFAGANSEVPTDPVIREHIRRFIEGFRSVSADSRRTREAMSSTLAMVTGAAKRKVFADSITNNPLARAATGTVEAEVEQVTRLDADNWLVLWRERVTDLDGAERGASRWAGQLKLRFRMAEDGATEAEIKANPLGVLIEDLEWHAVAR
jgi:hypothetical protein